MKEKLIEEKEGDAGMILGTCIILAILLIVISMVTGKSFAFSADNKLDSIFKNQPTSRQEYQGREGMLGVLVSPAKHESGMSAEEPKQKVVYKIIHVQQKQEPTVTQSVTWCDEQKEVCR